MTAGMDQRGAIGIYEVMESPTNVEKFTAAYTEALTYYVKKNPDDYGYTVDGVPKVVAKMIPAYANGTASSGPAMKRAATKCGINPTLSAVRAFLNA